MFYMTIKRLLIACLVLISVQSFGQNPTNYLLRNTRERLISSMVDSMFRIPRYNGTPSGVRVGETSAIDGAIAMDTTNHLLYMFSGNAWVRIAKYSELGSGAVDSIWRVAGQDSIKWRRNGTTFAIKDSSGALIHFGLEDNSGGDRSWTADGGSFRWSGLPSYSDTSTVYPLGLTRTGDTMVLMNRWPSGGGGSSDSTLQQITENGDSTTYRVISNDTLKGADGYIHSSQYIGDTTFANNDTAYYWGTSVSAGSTLSSPSTERFATLTSAEYGWIQSNHGTGGATISTLISELALIPVYNSSRAAIFFEYGMNDCSSTDTTTWKSSYQRAIDTCFARGWPASRLFILSPTFSEASGRPYITRYVTASHTVANTNGITWINTYAYMQARGGTALTTDSVHPNAFGHYIIWQAITHGLTGIKKLGKLDLRGTAKLRGVTWLGEPGDEYPAFPAYTPPTGSILNVKGKSYFSTKMFVQGTTDYSSFINVGLSSSENALTAFDNGRNSQITISGKEIYFYDWANTQYLTMYPTYWSLPSAGFDWQGGGGNTNLKISNNTEVVVNDGSIAMNFRVEGDGNAYLIKTDGTNDRVGIKNSAPDSTLDVTGSLRTTGGVRHQNLPTTTPAYLAMLDANGTMYKVDTTGMLGGGGGSPNKVDTIYRTPGKDSIQFTIAGRYHAIKDSIGSGGSSGLTIGTTTITSGTASRIPFQGSGSTLVQDADFTYDSTYNTSEVGQSRDGQWGGGATYAAWGHKTALASSSNNYAVLADNAGNNYFNSASVLSFRIANSDIFKVYNGYSGFNATPNSAVAFWLSPSVNTQFGMIIQGQASQASPLLEFRNSSNTTISQFDKDGKLSVGAGTPTSTLQVAGSFSTAYVSKAVDYTATISDNVIEVTATGKTITLPTAVGITGRQYTVVYTGSSGSSTIATTSSQTFTNITATPTTLTLSALGSGAITSYTVTSNGANWIVTGKVKNE